MVADATDGFRDSPISPDEIRAYIEANRTRWRSRGMIPRKQLLYFCKGTSDVPLDWEGRIDAADLLSKVFNELSENRVPTPRLSTRSL